MPLCVCTFFQLTSIAKLSVSLLTYFCKLDSCHKVDEDRPRAELQDVWRTPSNYFRNHEWVWRALLGGRPPVACLEARTGTYDLMLMPMRKARTHKKRSSLRAPTPDKSIVCTGLSRLSWHCTRFGVIYVFGVVMRNLVGDAMEEFKNIQTPCPA